MHYSPRKRQTDFVRIARPVAPALVLILAFIALRGGGQTASMKTERGAASDLDSLIRNASALEHTFARISDSMALLLDRVSTLPLRMPTEGLLSSRRANMRLHPVLNRSMPHRGIDVAAPMGTPVVAPGAGRVLRVERAGGYGLLVELDHGDGLVTRYAHCSRAFVKAGDQVPRGTTIAAVGNSGLTTGPHLHYEIIFKGQSIDPLILMNY